MAPLTITTWINFESCLAICNCFNLSTRQQFQHSFSELEFQEVNSHRFASNQPVSQSVSEWVNDSRDNDNSFNLKIRDDIEGGGGGSTAAMPCSFYIILSFFVNACLWWYQNQKRLTVGRGEVSLYGRSADLILSIQLLQYIQMTTYFTSLVKSNLGSQTGDQIRFDLSNKICCCLCVVKQLIPN